MNEIKISTDVNRSANSFFANLHAPSNTDNKDLENQGRSKRYKADLSEINNYYDFSVVYVAPISSNPSFNLQSFHLKYGWVRTKSNSRNKYYWYSPLLQLSIWEPNETHSAVVRQSQVNYPFLEIRRNLFLELCHQRFVSMNEAYGPMKGNTKTATSCREEGMKIGLQGMFARFLWNQLLEMARIFTFTSMTEFAFPPRYFAKDLSVEKELVDAGRTTEQAQQMLVTLADGFADCHYMMSLIMSDYQALPTEIVELHLNNSSLPIKSINNLHEQTMYSVVFKCATGVFKQDITGRHLNKLSNLYATYNKDANNHTFVRSFYMHSTIYIPYHIIVGTLFLFTSALP